MNQFSAHKHRPALYHVHIPDIRDSYYSFAASWHWVCPTEVANIAGISLRELLLEFADFHVRWSKYTGIFFLKASSVDPEDNTYYPTPQGPIEKRSGQDFFWDKKSLQAPYKMSSRPSAIDVFCSSKILVPSGWANRVLDEIERRRRSGKPITEHQGARHGAKTV